MSSNNSIEKDIIDDLISAIQNVTIVNGYPLDLDSGAVSDDYLDLESLVYDFTVLVHPDASEPEDETGRRTINVVSWIIEVAIAGGDTASANRYKLAASIRDAIMADPRRSELCTNTTITRTEYFSVEEDEGCAYFVHIYGASRTSQSVTNYRNQ